MSEELYERAICFVVTCFLVAFSGIGMLAIVEAM